MLRGEEDTSSIVRSFTPLSGSRHPREVCAKKDTFSRTNGKTDKQIETVKFDLACADSPLYSLHELRSSSYKRNRKRII